MIGSGLRRIDSRRIPNARGEIRATLVVRNESLRLPAVLDHHRKLGVDRFFVVDSGSTDGTLDWLRAQPDVRLFAGDAPFRTHKAIWRHALLREFFDGCWGLHLDADELFVHPGMERVGLPRFCEFLDREGVVGAFAVLVDMYAAEPLERVRYRRGDSLPECFPFFDRSGYHLRFRGIRHGRTVAPLFQVSGGPRERVFFEPHASRWRRALAASLFDIRHREPPRATRIPGLGPLLNRVAKRALPDYAPNCGKVPLLRWAPGHGIQTWCLEALHEVEPRVPLSRCWSALLHFKNIPGLRERVHEAVEQKLYGEADREYERYHQVLRVRDEIVFFGPQSTRFESTADLLEAGLMRSTPEWETHAAVSSRASEASEAKLVTGRRAIPVTSLGPSAREVGGAPSRPDP